jgi:hypothetical protein
LGGDYRVTTSITLKALESKLNQRRATMGDGMAMLSVLAAQIASECVR